MNRAVIALLCLSWALPLQAHQMKAAITTVLFNARSGHVEIMHRFYLHDAEHVLSEINGEQIHLLTDAAASLQFGRYVASHFSLAYAEDKAEDLTYVGQELDGKFIWVYQELLLPTSRPDALWFRHSALQDYWPEQVNQVNVEGLGGVKGLRFMQDNSWQSIRLDARH